MAWHRDASGQTVGYVSADATGVGQQGPEGAKAEGRMVYVGMIYNPVPDDPARWANSTGRHPKFQARYVTELAGGLAGLATPLRRQAAQVGLERVDRWIALSDGGSGLEDFFRTNFGRVAAVILDFYHVAERLSNFAKLWHPGQEAAAQELADTWCTQLKHAGGPAVLAVLQALDVQGRSAALREAHRELVGYFTNHQHRMDYPHYQAQGWAIGSGPVESACKTVVGQRLKGAGMRWSVAGADAVCHLRALFRSEPSQWEAFWHTPA